MTTIQTPVACPDCANSREQARFQEARAQIAEANLQSFKDRVRNRMIQEAENRGWCAEFDQILEEFGMEPRRRQWTVTISVSGTLEVGPLIARDADHAGQIALHAAQRDHSNYDLELTDFDVESVDEAESD